jgi:multiple sugar transport system permease protein
MAAWKGRCDMRLRYKKRWLGVLFTLPYLAGFFLLFIIPFFISVSYTFTRGVGIVEFAGLDNYIDVINGSAFQLAFFNTFRFLLLGVPLVMGISLWLACMVNGKLKGMGVFRSIFLYPMVLPVASVVMFFRVFLADNGIINYLMNLAGLPVTSWLQSDKAFGVLLFLYIWKNCGYNMVLFLAGLNAIPEEYREIARMEGAGRRQIFFRITLPLLEPAFLFVFIISIMNGFKCFREAYLLAGNMPHPSIYMLQHFMNNNFDNLNYQRLSVAALLTFLWIFLMVVVIFVVKARREKGA